MSFLVIPDSIFREGVDPLTGVIPAQAGPKRVSASAQFAVVCLVSRLRGNDGVGVDDASRTTASNPTGRPWACADDPSRSARKRGDSNEAVPSGDALRPFSNDKSRPKNGSSGQVRG